MPIGSFEITLSSAMNYLELVHRVQKFIEHSPFALHDVEQSSPNHWNCVFVVSQPNLVVGFRSVTELISRMAFEFEVFRVERIVGPPTVSRTSSKSNSITTMTRK